MAAGAKIRLKIKATQRDAAGETTEQLTNFIGEYFKRSGKFYVRYDDDTIHDNAKVKTLLKFDDSSLLVKRQGIINSEQRFETGKAAIAAYKTPYGTLDLEIITKDLWADLKANKHTLDISYALNINGAKQSDNTLHLEMELL